MTAPLPHRVFEELAVGYALGALEPEDEAMFVAHLESCESCGRAVAEHLDTMAQLAYAAPPAEPPAALLEGIRAGVRESGRATTEPPERPDRSDDELERRRARRPRPAATGRAAVWVGVAAAAALILGLGGWNLALQQNLDDQSTRSDRLEQTLQALTSTETQPVRLTDASGDVLAVAMVQDEQVRIVVDGLPPNPDGTTYVLWGANASGNVVALGTFDVAQAGLDVRPAVSVEAGVGEVTTLMVTREPGETPPPVATQPVVVSGEV